MPKKPVSVTLDQDNLLWLRGRVAGGKRRSLSDALDEVIRAVRLDGRASDSIRSVVGTVDVAADDPGLDRADALLQAEVQSSLGRPFLVRETQPVVTSKKAPVTRSRKRASRAR
jgi:hypothetical protein